MHLFYNVDSLVAAHRNQLIHVKEISLNHDIDYDIINLFGTSLPTPTNTIVSLLYLVVAMTKEDIPHDTLYAFILEKCAELKIEQVDAIMVGVSLTFILR